MSNNPLKFAYETPGEAFIGIVGPQTYFLILTMKKHL